MANPQNSELHDFIEFLFGGLNGTAYVATTVPDDRTDWSQHFFSYPADASRMETVILQSSADHEVYIAPVLYKSEHYARENFKCSNVVWTEFDGNAPNEEAYFTTPSYRIKSSEEANQHVYWKLTEPVYNVDSLERINKNITYNLAADSSAWDATQVLRPPGTINHKPDREGQVVSVLSGHSISYEVTVFDVLPDAPQGPDISEWKLGTLPNLEDVVFKYSFTPDMSALFQKDKDSVKDRSVSLMNLAYGLAQMGMSDAEIFVCVLNADERWGKFKDRKDRNKRLAHIITVARHKYPDNGDSDSSDPYAFALDFVSLLTTDIDLDWVVEPMLMEQGSMLMVGPSGIGKTQISLRFMIHLALGRNYLHYVIPKPRKIIFFSLEMGFGELKEFIAQMAKTLTPEDLEILQQNLILIPHGEKWPLNVPVGQEHALRMIETYEPDGVFVDSVGSAIQGNISDDESVGAYLDFIDRVRKKYGVFWWAIHHMRKSSNGGHTPTSQDDVYGNQYLVNRSSSSYGILRGRDGLIKVRNFKNRLHKAEDDFMLKRVDHLDFEKIVAPVDKQVESISYKKPEEDKGPTAGKFDL